MNQELLLALFATKALQNIALIRIRFTWLMRSNAVWNEKPNGQKKKIVIETGGSGVGRASKWTATTTKSYSNLNDFVHVGLCHVRQNASTLFNFRNLLSIFFLQNSNAFPFRKCTSTEVHVSDGVRTHDDSVRNWLQWRCGFCAFYKFRVSLSFFRCVSNTLMTQYVARWSVRKIMAVVLLFLHEHLYSLVCTKVRHASLKCHKNNNHRNDGENDGGRLQFINCLLWAFVTKAEPFVLLLGALLLLSLSQQRLWRIFGFGRIRTVSNPSVFPIEPINLPSRQGVSVLPSPTRRREQSVFFFHRWLQNSVLIK